ncbi:hypothetical protein AVEN_79456-1 [Araneus ventricosus]|uniref:Uncharacterized protein n=1 Tax=Araneus ventricosus TaxID=182803 RepID=A0A4Y2LU14_ARAVE|nr:hypothetical protein AVEN_48522-1 [Araneus ventricosus]GBN17016.1 hypothetical protein AVEN_79456-1 [Araneus ventricosus]
MRNEYDYLAKCPVQNESHYCIAHRAKNLHISGRYVQLSLTSINGIPLTLRGGLSIVYLDFPYMFQWRTPAGAVLMVHVPSVPKQKDLPK